METERIGPLAYSLDTPDGDLSAERPIILGIAAAAGAAMLASALGWLAHDWVGNRGLLLWTCVASVWAVGLATAWLTSRGGRRRRRRNALVGVALAASVLSFGTYALVDISRPTLTQLRYAIDDVDLPETWTVLSREETGNRRCDPGCPKIVIVYRIPGVEDPGDLFLRELLAQGWSPADPHVPADASTAAVRGMVLADVFTSFGSRDIRVVIAQQPPVTQAG